MRRFLTGYAITYNLIHHRHGHLFQNRYKSIICDENLYFTELVRYIHLNPLRAKLVKTLEELDRYRYCGHSVLMGKVKYECQDIDCVLKVFGDKEGEARRAYRDFVKGGIDSGRRPELVGGGLIRSTGDWSEVMSLRRRGEQKLTDERILGGADFVKEVLEDADEKLRKRISANDQREKIKKVIQDICKKEGVNIKELQSGSRRDIISIVRAKITFKLVEMYGVPLAEIARNVGVSTSAVSKILKRNVSI